MTCKVDANILAVPRGNEETIKAEMLRSGLLNGRVAMDLTEIISSLDSDWATEKMCRAVCRPDPCCPLITGSVVLVAVLTGAIWVNTFIPLVIKDASEEEKFSVVANMVTLELNLLMLIGISLACAGYGWGSLAKKTCTQVREAPGIYSQLKEIKRLKKKFLSLPAEKEAESKNIKEYLRGVSELRASLIPKKRNAEDGLSADARFVDDLVRKDLFQMMNYDQLLPLLRLLSKEELSDLVSLLPNRKHGEVINMLASETLGTKPAVFISNLNGQSVKKISQMEPGLLDYLMERHFKQFWNLASDKQNSKLIEACVTFAQQHKKMVEGLWSAGEFPEALAKALD